MNKKMQKKVIAGILDKLLKLRDEVEKQSEEREIQHLNNAISRIVASVLMEKMGVKAYTNELVYLSVSERDFTVNRKELSGLLGNIELEDLLMENLKVYKDSFVKPEARPNLSSEDSQAKIEPIRKSEPTKDHILDNAFDINLFEEEIITEKPKEEKPKKEEKPVQKRLSDEELIENIRKEMLETKIEETAPDIIDFGERKEEEKAENPSETLLLFETDSSDKREENKTETFIFEESETEPAPEPEQTREPDTNDFKTKTNDDLDFSDFFGDMDLFTPVPKSNKVTPTPSDTETDDSEIIKNEKNEDLFLFEIPSKKEKEVPNFKTKLQEAENDISNIKNGKEDDRKEDDSLFLFMEETDEPVLNNPPETQEEKEDTSFVYEETDENQTPLEAEDIKYEDGTQEESWEFETPEPIKSKKDSFVEKLKKNKDERNDVFMELLLSADLRPERSIYVETEEVADNEEDVDTFIETYKLLYQYETDTDSYERIKRENIFADVYYFTYGGKEYRVNVFPIYIPKKEGPCSICLMIECEDSIIVELSGGNFKIADAKFDDFHIFATARIDENRHFRTTINIKHSEEVIKYSRKDHLRPSEKYRGYGHNVIRIGTANTLHIFPLELDGSGDGSIIVLDKDFGINNIQETYFLRSGHIENVNTDDGDYTIDTLWEDDEFCVYTQEKKLERRKETLF